MIRLLISGNHLRYQPQVGASADALVAFYDGDRTRILIAAVFAGLAVLNRLKVMGAATYPIDVTLPGMAHAALLQSTVTSGRIRYIAVDAAERSPGVLAVITHADAPALAHGPMTPLGPSPLPPLQRDAVLHYGQHVAMVVAETIEQAQAAAALIDVTYERDTPILFDSAGVGRSTGTVPNTIGGMAAHALDFLDGLGLDNCDVLGFSLGGMVAQQMARERPSIFRRMILVGTAPRGGEDIMHLEKPGLARHLGDPTLKGHAVLQKIFFAPTASSQAAGGGFIERLAQRKEDLDPASGPDVAAAQMAAFREWEPSTGTPLRRSQGHPSAHARRQWHPRRNDSRLELLSVEREPCERGASRLPGLGTRFPPPVSRLLHPARGGIPRVGRAVRALLSRRELNRA